MADYRYRLIPTPQKVDSTYLNNIMNILARYPNESFVINFKNTKEFSLTDIRKIDGVSSNRVLIRVEGGYDQHRIDSYPRESHVNIHKYDNIYTISEIKSQFFYQNAKLYHTGQKQMERGDDESNNPRTHNGRACYTQLINQLAVHRLI